MDSNLPHNKIYTVLVAGDVDLSDYDLNKQVSPYVVYKYNEKHKIREQAINVYQEFVQNINSKSNNQLLKPLIECKLQEIIEMTDEEYFEKVTNGMTFDNKTGDALNNINPKGRYRTIKEANEKYTVPLFEKSFECQVCDLDLTTKKDDLSEKYAEHWDYIMTCAPFIKEEYINNYKDKDTYVNVMTEPLFYNAFVSEKTGWLEQGDEDQIQWILTFKERFIDNLPKNTKLKVYNFTR